MLRRLIVEAHRRSIWQVLTVYAVGSWGALQIVDALTNSAGLPEWVPGFALVLLILGLPMVLATAFVQEGMPGGRGDREAGSAASTSHTEDAADGAPATTSYSYDVVHAAPAVNLAAGTGALDVHRTRPTARQRLFTWRNAAVGGVGAFALLGIVVAAYFLMRATGVGPWASLAAQGLMDEREPVVLAEFDNTTADSTLGQMVTEALRIDLLASPAVTVLPPAYVADAVQRTGRTPDTRLTPALAREIATRDGIKAVIEGDVGAVGSGYVLTASIADPASGAALAAFRETAAGEADLLNAIDRLSRRIREKAGESLRSINAGEPLSAVTTASLDALRAYTSGLSAFNGGRWDESVRLFKRAVELDPDFAMAHRRLASQLYNNVAEPELMRASATRAYELRSRLTRPEALFTEATYHTFVTGDDARAIDAYRQLLQLRPDDSGALTNLASRLTRSRADVQESIELLTRAMNGPAAYVGAYHNLVVRLWDVGRDDEIDAAIAAAQARYPDNYFMARLGPSHLASRRRFAEAHAALDSVRLAFPAPRHQIDALFNLAGIDAALGRAGEARTHMRDAMRIAEESGATGLRHDAVVRLASVELLTTRDPARARAVLRDMLPEDRFEQMDHFSLANASIVAALAGDLAFAERIRQALDATGSDGGRMSEAAAGIELTEWALHLARNDAEAALAAAQRFQRVLSGDCQGRRCYGAFEQAYALDELGRTSDAIAAYENHMDGLPFGATHDEGVMTPTSLERLAELSERQGDVDKAIRYYSEFIELWKDADAELQPRVQRARDRAAALLASRG